MLLLVKDLVKEFIGMNKFSSKHLLRQRKVNLGSFYTPKQIVGIVQHWLMAEQIDSFYTIIDSSCGVGAFFELNNIFQDNKFIGNDIDSEAIEYVQKSFSSVKTYSVNALQDVSRSMFGLSENEKVVFVGNPPYNDTTSIVGKSIKTEKCRTDIDLKSRDLGISFLLSYNKLSADYAAILHPLSYLIKKANFRAAKDFFHNYRILNCLVFSSSLFENTSVNAGFPIIVALYKRNPQCGTHYEDVLKMDFHTIEENCFNLSKMEFVSDYIDKYPGKKRYEPEILFYTLRDINALKRCRTFLKERIANAVDVNPEKIAYYCYIDCFKRYAKTPYWMGNLNVPFEKASFDAMKDKFIRVAKYNNQDIFGKTENFEKSDFCDVSTYIERIIKACSGKMP